MEAINVTLMLIYALSNHFPTQVLPCSGSKGFLSGLQKATPSEQPILYPLRLRCQIQPVTKRSNFVP